jgi:hypothetical protein
VAHNRAMIRIRFILAVALALGIAGTASLYAQETEPVGDQDGSSERVEQTDEAFRRQMELEDARSKDRTYVDTTYTEKIDQEKIDKLPEGSRDNIRDQLVDVIMENGDWEPKDALEEYPYQPSAEAQSDAELEEQEQEAWDEQIQKYNEREAAAFEMSAASATASTNSALFIYLPFSNASASQKKRRPGSRHPHPPQGFDAARFA